MAAGTIAGAGYFMGERIHQARISNPKGFFESGEINQINEALLAPLIPASEDGRLRQGQRWLSTLPIGTQLPGVDASTELRIHQALSHRPFCFKDPRFCYTLPIWRRYVPDAAIVCVFRNPDIVASSILIECERLPNLHNLEMTSQKALSTWRCMYEHILTQHDGSQNWHFMEYEQFFEPTALAALESFLEAKVDYSFPAHDLLRSKPGGFAQKDDLQIYNKLRRFSSGI